MRINTESVVNAAWELSRTTTNKFWGALALISSIDGPIQPNKTYKLSSNVVMAFLDNLFSLNQEIEKGYVENAIYVKFSKNWKERLESLTLRNKPSLKSAAIFYCKKNEYSHGLNSVQIKDVFLNECKIGINKLNNLFLDAENEFLGVASYENSELIKAFETKFNVLKKEGYHLSLESPYFIQSKPSELKRAPFIQTLYSGDRIKELLLLSDSNLEDLYPVTKDEVLRIHHGETFSNFIDSLSLVGFRFPNLVVKRFLASLITKRFVILTGLSGSGKTKLAQAFVQWICDSRPSGQTLYRFKSGEEIKSERVSYKIIQSDFNSVTFEQIDSKTKVTLPYELIYEWVEVIDYHQFDASTPIRKIRDLVGESTKYSTQLNSFESHLKLASFELISRIKMGSQVIPQYQIVPVGADWTNREPLLGYPNALNPKEYVKPDSGVLDLIIEAHNQPDLPFFLILDEMNLSHVERYFADFLSAMESKEKIPLHSGEIENGVPSKLELPSNLFIIGTVNIDETTNMFSPKVLDRANTIEFRVTQDEMKSFLANIKVIDMDALTGKGAGMAKSFLEMAADQSFAVDEEINDALIKFFGELSKTGTEFGYRSASEILRLIHQLTVLDSSLGTPQKIDIAIMQKLLPKLHGSQRRISSTLKTLGSFCVSATVDIEKIFQDEEFDYEGTDVLYPLSLEKIARMYRGAIANGFTSFAEA